MNWAVTVLPLTFQAMFILGPTVDGWSSLKSDMSQADLNDLQRQMSACYFVPVCQEGKTVAVQAVLFWGASIDTHSHVLPFMQVRRRKELLIQWMDA